MKIEITDEELQINHEFYQRDDVICKAGILGGPNNTGSYSINFDVNDGEKASYFFQALMYDKELVEYLKEKAGFEVTSINLFPARNSTEYVIEELQSLVDRLKNS